MSDGKLTAEQVRKAAKSNSRQYESPVDDGVWITEYDWQAIADELNAMLGNGTCECENCAPPLDVLLRCLENDYGIRASWDGLRHVWLTESVTAELDYIEDNSRWFELFGTPEQAARTLMGICEECEEGVCSGCKIDPLMGYATNYDGLLEWLRGDAE